MSTDNVIDHIWSHRRVCSNCFRLRHTETPVPDRITALAQRTVWASAVTPRWTQTRYAQTDAPPGANVSDRKPQSVCECGTVDPSTRQWSSINALAKDTAISYTANLTETLDALSVEALEHGDERLSARLAHDEDALFDAVRYLKSIPKYQDKDERIFAVGVEVACRRRDEPPCGINDETSRTK